MSLYLSLNQCCGVETRLRLGGYVNSNCCSAHYYEIPYVLSKLPYLFSIKMATLYKNVFSNQVFCCKISSSLINRKEPEPEPEPQFVISAPAGNLSSAPCSTGSGSRTLPLTDQMYQRVCCNCEEQTYRKIAVRDQKLVENFFADKIECTVLHRRKLPLPV